MMLSSSTPCYEDTVIHIVNKLVVVKKNLCDAYLNLVKKEDNVKIQNFLLLCPFINLLKDSLKDVNLGY